MISARETQGKELQDALEVFKIQYPAATLSPSQDGGVTVTAKSSPDQANAAHYHFYPPQAAIPFLLGEAIALRVRRRLTFVQNEFQTVMAHSKFEAEDLAAKTSNDWEVSPLYYETTRTDVEVHDSDTAHGEPIPHLLWLRFGDRSALIDLDEVEVLDEVKITEANEAEALSVVAATSAALVIPANQDGIAEVFQTIDALTARAARGDQQAKTELAEKTKGLRLKMSLVKFMQSQADRNNR